jgi:HSP20 family protein
VADKKDEREPKVDINIGLGGLFKNLGELVNSIAGLVEQAGQAGGETRQAGELKLDPEGKLRGVYGFTIRSGIGGAPQVERFGNIRPTPAGAEVAEVREPLVDLFDEGGEMRLIAELPGVDEAEIRVELNDDVLALETLGERRYAKELLLPAPGDPASLATSYRNGILEIRIVKRIAP